MKIYVAHSTAFDFKSDLYGPISESDLMARHDFIFPHAGPSVSDSREVIRTADLVLAEVSYASTGLGIELGWASLMGKKVIAIYRTGTKPSSSISIITNNLYEYTPDSLIDTLTPSLQGTQ